MKNLTARQFAMSEVTAGVVYEVRGGSGKAMVLAADSAEKRILRTWLRPSLSFCALLALGVIALPAAFSQTAPAPSQPRHQAKTAQAPPQPNPVPPAPTVAPNLLDQPAVPATITSANNELTVNANNSSLSQILRQVSSKTGMQLDGLGGDERVFGSFGPGAPREVLTALLNGTSYNVVMVGDLPNGAPRELLLTRRTGDGSSSQPLNAAQNPGQNQNGQNGDDATPDDSSSGDDSSPDDSAPPMQYTPPSIAPAAPPPNNPRAMQQQNAPE
jgi:hypothetical protein